MTFYDMNKGDFQAIAESLNSHYTLGEIKFFPMQLVDMSDEQTQEIIDKIPEHLLPSDYDKSQNRAIIGMAAMHAL